LHRGDKALVGNTGFRRFLKTVGDGHFAIDRSKADEDARFVGVFVLRTNTDLNPLAAMLRYKQLWAVEQTFRTAKGNYKIRVREWSRRACGRSVE
jgi:IS4 transposase